MPKLIPPVRDTHIVAALKRLNAARGLESIDIGYCYYADIKGDGRNIRRVWVIINEHGGVTRSDLNRETPRETLSAINQAIMDSMRQPKPVGDIVDALSRFN